MTHTKGNSAIKVQAALLYDGNPARRSNKHCSTIKTITTICYQQCITTIIFYSYFHKSRTNTRRDSCIQGERCRSGASFLQVLTCLNFFDFQIFEYLSFNDFSIVIDNSPESNGYIYIFIHDLEILKIFDSRSTKTKITGPQGPNPHKFKNFFQFCLCF